MPSPVDKYFDQIKEKNPSYSDEQAWATAWSIFCKNTPGSSHCHKPPSEYLRGKEAASADFTKRYNRLVEDLRALRDLHGMDPQRIALQAVRTLEVRNASEVSLASRVASKFLEL
jgi:hypothetical protein